MKWKLSFKLTSGIVLICLLIISSILIGGYRFTAIQAVKSSSFIEGNIKVFGEVDRDWTKVYLLEAQNGIKTAMSEKSGLLWRCPAVTYFYDDIIKNDKVKTVGWVSVNEGNHKQITVFAVQTNDPDVKFIEAGTNSDRQRKTIGLNETVIFTWNKVIDNNINAIAYNKDNSELYKYEYNPINLSVTNSKELRWYPLSNR